MTQRDSREVQETVRRRLDERGVHLGVMKTNAQVVNIIVWETVAVLCEWNLLALEPLEGDL